MAMGIREATLTTSTKLVMAGLVPAIHVFASYESKTWMPGT